MSDIHKYYIQKQRLRASYRKKIIAVSLNNTATFLAGLLREIHILQLKAFDYHFADEREVINTAAHLTELTEKVNKIMKGVNFEAI